MPINVSGSLYSISVYHFIIYYLKLDHKLFYEQWLILITSYKF